MSDPEKKRTGFLEDMKRIKDQPFQDRIWFVWTYYKVQIIILFVCLYLTHELGACIYRNMQDTLLYLAVINEPGVTASGLRDVQQNFEALEGFDQDWKKTTEFDSSMQTDDPDDPFYTTASGIRLQSLLSTQTIDLMITDSYMNLYYASENTFCDLKEVLTDELWKELEAGDRIVYQQDSSGREFAAAISLDDSWLSEKLTLKEGSLLSVCTAKHQAVSEEFISYCLDGPIPEK